MKVLCSCLLCLISIFSFSQYENIRIDVQDGKRYPPCEPSIAVSKTDPNIIVAGSVLDNIYLSSDAGRTWEKERLSSDLGVYGDPCIVSDYKGNFYYLHLSNPIDAEDRSGWLDRIVCQYSDDDGKNWTSGSSIGLNGKKDQDKEWAAIDPKTNRIYTTWTQFDGYDSSAEKDSTLILFSQSKGKNKKWSKPVRISQIAGDCLDDDETVEGAIPAVGPNGEIYVAWALNETIYFDRSFDRGKCWEKNDIEAGTIVGGWSQDIPGIMRCNGMPVTCCDLSNNDNRGTIYVNYTDQKNGTDDTDVWLIKSNDQGSTWSDPVRVNDDAPGSHQFFTWMDIDDSTGYLYFVFYDRRNYDDTQTDVYLAVSKDGGETFSNEKISESPFTPDPKVFFGDYNNLSAEQGIVRPIWTRYDENGLSVWTAIIDKK